MIWTACGRTGAMTAKHSRTAFALPSRTSVADRRHGTARTVDLPFSHGFFPHSTLLRVIVGDGTRGGSGAFTGAIEAAIRSAWVRSSPAAASDSRVSPWSQLR